MIEVSNLPARTLMGLSRPIISATHLHSNAPAVIGQLWGEMSKLFFSMKLDRSTNPIGVGAMWPDLKKGAGHMVYFAGYEVAALPEELGGLEALEVEESSYAFVQHFGPMNELPELIRDFYTNLLPNSGIQRRDGMDLEIYVENEDPTQPTLVTIAAPVL